MGFRIKEAYDKAIEKGHIKSRIELANKLYPDASVTNQRMKVGNLLNGSTKKLDLESMQIICKVLKVDANFICNIKK